MLCFTCCAKILTESQVSITHNELMRYPHKYQGSHHSLAMSPWQLLFSAAQAKLDTTPTLIDLVTVMIIRSTSKMLVSVFFMR